VFAVELLYFERDVIEERVVDVGQDVRGLVD
jgi:hypothetical protein